jgi:uncharacterized ion transporter superfamily protein YfcC
VITTFTGNNGFSGITNIINTTDATSNGTSASLKNSGGTWVAKHIQLPAVGAGIRLGIIIRAFVILIKVHYKQERTHNITI